MRKLISLVLFGLLALGLIVPAVYLQYSATLPDLGSQEALHALLAHRIESARTASRPVGVRYVAERFEVIPLERLPRGLVAAILAKYACPGYLAAPKEQGGALLRRLLDRARGVAGPPSPERCQLAFADHLARFLGVGETIPAAIADRRILRVLSVEQLLEYRIATLHFTDALVGPRPAAREAFGKPLEKLAAAECAELLAAESHWQEISGCTSAPRARLLRDEVLDRMAEQGTLSQLEAAAARARPASGCLHRGR